MIKAPLRYLCLAVTLAVIIPAFSARAEDAIGQIKTRMGDVKVVRHGVPQPLSVGDHVFQSDTISTAKGASVGITFVDNSMMSLGPNSQLALDQFQFDTTTHAGVFNTSLTKGTLAVKSGQIVQQTPEAMRIKTPAALLGVRGTEFAVRADENS
jgi:hypothetical protein